jgi:uncharacterized protein
MGYAEILQAAITIDSERWAALALVRGLNLPDCWIGAGFVRNAVWDRLHGRNHSPIIGDIDVVWFDPDEASLSKDRALELALAARQPQLNWSVKNQARMHSRNSDRTYVSALDALRHWPETATLLRFGARRRTSARSLRPMASTIFSNCG